MDNKTARQDLETVIRVEDLALGSMRKLRAIQDWLRDEAEKAQQHITDLEKVATDFRRDLMLRAEPDWDGSGQQVVNLSASIWDELNRVLDIKGNRREGKEETCTYPDCRCPFDMGPDHQCLKGLHVIRK